MDKPQTKRLKRPSDPMQLAKLVGDIATGQIKDVPKNLQSGVSEPTQEQIRAVMSMLGKIGGPKGGKARAEKLSKKRKVEIAKKAALVRWTEK